MILVYTPIYAALLAILLIVLAGRVAASRHKHKVGVGDHGQKELLQTIRVHANATEYVPIGLILLALTEINGANLYLVNGAGIAFVLGRLMHVAGLSKSIGVSFGRFYGSALSWLVIIILAIYCLIVSLAHLWSA